MSDNTGMSWGVPEDAPPPRKRSTWGTGQPQTGPAGRDEQQHEDAAWIPAPGDDFDLAAFHAGTLDESLPQPTVVNTANDPLTDDPFADSSPPTYTPPAGTGGRRIRQDSIEMSPEPEQSGLAGLFDDFPTEPTYTPTKDSELPTVVESFNTPAPYTPQEAQVEAVQKPSQLAAWETSQQQSVAQGSVESVREDINAYLENQAFMERYQSAERYQVVVDRLLGLAKSGAPKLQGLLNGFVLSRDHEVDARQRAEYEDVMFPLMAQNQIAIDPADLKTVLDIAYDELIGIGPLGPLWRDDDVTEIMVSGPDKISVERNGSLALTPVRFRDAAHLRQTARDLSMRVDDRAVSRQNPIVTAQLDKARVQFVLAPVAPIAGVSMTIRKFRPLFGIDDLLRFNALTEEMVAFLSDIVASRANVLVSGGTGSGKTTMINALSAFIPDTERVVTIEDALELELSNTHVEQLLTKEAASADDTVFIGQDDLLRSALRMRPDRIVVGEIRDGSGCAVMLQAANTGHDGTMTTVHANSPDRALRRLSLLFRTTSENMGDDIAHEEVREAFDVVVQVIRRRGRRYVSAISMVDKEGTRTVPIFTGHYTAGAPAPVFKKVGSLSSDTDLAERFADAGLDPSVWE